MQTEEIILAGEEKRHVFSSKFPIFDKNGAVVMVGGTSTDVTERMRANEALRASEERFSAIRGKHRRGVLDQKHRIGVRGIREPCL